MPTESPMKPEKDLRRLGGRAILRLELTSTWSLPLVLRLLTCSDVRFFFLLQNAGLAAKMPKAAVPATVERIVW